MRLPEREEIFSNHGDWHPLLRTAVFVVAFLLVSLAMSIPIFILVPPASLDPSALLDVDTPTFVGVAWVLLAATALVVYRLTVRLDRQPWRATGLWLHDGWQMELLAGLGLGAVLMGVIFLVLVGTELAGIGPGPTSEAHALLLGVVVLLPMALAEELIFRGYLLRNLAQVWGARWALVVSAVVFAVLHHSNPDWNALALLNIALTGVLMGYAYLQSGSLWFPFGLHFAWNFAQGTLLGMPVSGLGVPGLIRTHLGRPYWLSGGSFGPEASVLGILALVAGMAYVVRRYGPPSGLPQSEPPDDDALPERAT